MKGTLLNIMPHKHRIPVIVIISIIIVSFAFSVVYTNCCVSNPYLYIESGRAIEDLEFGTKDYVYVAKLSSSVIERLNIENGQIDLLLFGHSSTITDMSFNRMRDILVSGSLDNSVIIWNAENGEIIRKLNGHRSGVTSVDISLSSNLIVSGDDSGIVNIWRTESGAVARTIESRSETIESIVISSDEQWIATKGDDGTINIWQASNGDAVATIEDSHRSSNLALLPKPLLLASGGLRSDVMLWQVPDGHELANLNAHTAIITALAFSPNGRFLATASGAEGNFWENAPSDPNIRIWSASTHELLTTVHASDALVEALAFSSDSKWLAMGNVKGDIKIWELSKFCSNCR